MYIYRIITFLLFVFFGTVHALNTDTALAMKNNKSTCAVNVNNELIDSVKLYDLFQQGIPLETIAEYVYLLDSYGANIVDSRGNTVLMACIQHCGEYLDICRFTSGDKAVCLLIDKFIELGGNVNHKNNEGETIFHLGIPHMERHVAEYLVTKGGDINICDTKGISPLMIACKILDGASIYYLLELGADGNVQDVNGRLATHYVPDPLLFFDDPDRIPPVAPVIVVYELLHQYGYAVDMTGRFSLDYLVYEAIDDALCSPGEITFLLNHGSEIGGFEDYIKNRPDFPNGEVYPVWRSIEEHEANIKNRAPSTLWILWQTIQRCKIKTQQQ
ncbi:MAG: hypothetical protein IKL98_03560 [Akkermansia sp.]|nr:hypothetical protein [Akkermansia sp.]